MDIEKLLRDHIEKCKKESEQPELNRLTELRIAIEWCKEKLREESVGSDNERKGSDSFKRELFDKLVQLGLEKQSIQDPNEPPKEEITQFRGHDFVLQPARGRNPCCEVCMGTIWRLVQSWRRCKGCGLRAHDKCTREVHRDCAALQASSSDFQFDLAICDEKSLFDQDYKCHECGQELCFETGGAREPRLCCLTGYYYCTLCHWNDMWPIPSRLIINMDPTNYPVCRASKQLLAIVQNKPLINMSELNPMMFKFHSGLKKVHKMRKDFLIMKCYFVSCKNAGNLRILQYLREHQHFVEEADLYTLRELKELASGHLMQELEDVYTVFKRHIEEECETCRGNGFFCELCESHTAKDQVLYPFSDNVSICEKCSYVFHLKCFEKNEKKCPRCLRRAKRDNFGMVQASR